MTLAQIAPRVSGLAVDPRTFSSVSSSGRDGRALIDVIADATDLTSPELWFSGTEREEVFSSIRDGAGESMPPYKTEFGGEQIWDLVNFTQSLWPEVKRPALREESPNTCCGDSAKSNPNEKENWP